MGSCLPSLSPSVFFHLNPNIGGSEVGIPPEEFNSWENTGRRRIRESGPGNSFQAERQSRLHHGGCEDAERYPSRWGCVPQVVCELS